MAVGKVFISRIEAAFREHHFDTDQSVVWFGDNGTYFCEWKTDDLKIQVELTKHESIGVMMNWLMIEKDILSGEGQSTLRALADSIENRLNYLMEPLKMIEFDEQNNTVQFRSAPPKSTEQHVAYFEMVLKSGTWFGQRNHVNLRRFGRTIIDHHREQVPFALTKRQLEKLVNDLAELL